MFRAFTQVLTVIVLVCSAIPAVAQSPVSRPYLARGVAQFAANQSDFVGSGYATHLGQYTEVGRVSFTPTADPAIFAVNGWAHYTASNGEELHADVSGTVNMLTGVIAATATYVGGVGRFATATGSSVLAGQMLGGGALTISAVGNLSF